jgi:hypothetical protein
LRLDFQKGESMMLTQLKQWLGLAAKPVPEQPMRKKSSTLLRLQRSAVLTALDAETRPERLQRTTRNPAGFSRGGHC